MSSKRKLTIPTGYGLGSLPFKQKHLFKANIVVVRRECQANSRTFGASLARDGCVYFGNVANKGLWYWFMHNGQPFANLDDITNLGLTPNVSAGKADSLQGSGLCYCASYLCTEAKLVIASKLPGGGLAAGSAEPNWSENEWSLRNESAHWQKELPNYLGKEFDNYNVWYMFRLPDWEITANLTEADEEDVAA
jgi:hypothetical protein